MGERKISKTMYSSSSLSKGLVPILAVMNIQFLLIGSVSSLNTTNAYLHHTCFASQGKYKPGSEYEKGLKDIIKRTLYSNFSGGLEMGTIGEGPSFVSVTQQCRGDSYGPKCRSCFSTTVSELQKRCPRYKGGIIWYDQCVLVFSAIDTEDMESANNSGRISGYRKEACS